MGTPCGRRAKCVTRSSTCSQTFANTRAVREAPASIRSRRGRGSTGGAAGGQARGWHRPSPSLRVGPFRTQRPQFPHRALGWLATVGAGAVSSAWARARRRHVPRRADATIASATSSYLPFFLGATCAHRASKAEKHGLGGSLAARRGKRRRSRAARRGKRRRSRAARRGMRRRSRAARRGMRRRHAPHVARRVARRRSRWVSARIASVVFRVRRGALACSCGGGGRAWTVWSAAC